MSQVDVVVTGGGTGGHVYPGLAVLEALRARHPGLSAAWVGTEKGVEADLVARAGYPFFAVPSQGLSRRLSWRIVGTGWTVAKGVGAAWRLLGRLRPRVVLGTGGYAAGPVVLAAALRRIPVVLQEQNAFPGLTNRMLSRFAWRTALGSPGAAKFFPDRSRLVVTGNPVREGIGTLSRQEGLRRLGLDGSRRFVFFMGASQGARTINEAFVAGSDALRKRDDLVFLLSTGKAAFASTCAALSKRWGQAEQQRGGVARWGNLRVTGYVDDMAAAYAAADLIVGRAGAISLAELTVRGVPAVLVPYPYAAEGHQEKNARELEEAGAAVVVADDDCARSLIPTVLALMDDPPRLAAMARASAARGRPDAARAVARLLETWLVPAAAAPRGHALNGGSGPGYT